MTLGRVSGALAGQVTLAAGSLVLQVAAAHALGAEGLGTYALLVGATVVATALSTGLVGDSLTVLDRHDARVRTALAALAAATVAVATGLAVALPLVTGALGAGEAALFGLATAAYMSADLVRRLLMAVQRFWSLVVVDGLGLAVAVLVLAGCWWVSDPVLGHLLLALALGQATAVAVGVACLPGPERAPWWPVRCSVGGVLAVVRFGGWRALQQPVRPATLTLARTVVLAAAGTAAVGQLEAARVLVAPVMILVQGAGSYLFASYAADRDLPLGPLRARADRAAVALLAVACAAGLAAAVVAPWAGPLLTGGGFALEPLAATGWVVYTASCAVVLPYGSLAAVRGRPGLVFSLRLADSALGLVLVLAVVGSGAGAPSLAPWLLSLGSFAGGLACRQLLVPSSSVGRARAGGGGLDTPSLVPHEGYSTNDVARSNHSTGTEARSSSTGEGARTRRAASEEARR